MPPFQLENTGENLEFCGNHIIISAIIFMQEEAGGVCCPILKLTCET